MKLRILCLLSALAAFVSPTYATTITLGGSGLNNIFPFGTDPSATPHYAGEYQQIYLASAFGGPLTIAKIAFETAFTKTVVSDTFTLSLGTTAASPAAPGNNYAANRKPDFTTVFSGTITDSATNTGFFDFIIPLTTPFIYNPANGNLLLDVNIISSSVSGGGLFQQFVAGNDANVGRVFNLGGTGAATAGPNYGLMTQFSEVPEPATVSLVAMGLAFGLRRWTTQRRRGD